MFYHEHFRNHDFDIPKCFFSCEGIKDGSCQFFFSLSWSRSKVKGHSFRNYGTNSYAIYGRYSVKRLSKPDDIECKYSLAILNVTFK